MRFTREGYVANTVGHPGAVSVLDDDVTEDGAAFLVMELLEGETLDHRWEKGGNVAAGRGARPRGPASRRARRGARQGDLAPGSEAGKSLPDARGATQGARLRHRPRARTHRGANRRFDPIRIAPRYARLHGSGASAGALGRRRRAFGSLGGGRDDVHASHGPFRARDRNRQRAAHPDRDAAGAADLQDLRRSAGRRRSHRRSGARLRETSPLGRRSRVPAGRARRASVRGRRGKLGSAARAEARALRPNGGGPVRGHLVAHAPLPARSPPVARS